MLKTFTKIVLSITFLSVNGCVKDRDLIPSANQNGNPANPTPTASPAVRNPVINEFMAKNTTITCPDSMGGTYNSADWVEIFNPNDTPLDLAGYYITDSLPDPKKFQIGFGNSAKTTIPAQGHLLIWCDDFIHLSPLHTGFKLSSTGEQIGLYTSEGAMCDTLSFTAQSQDISYGRLPDGGNTWRYFNPATPGNANQ